ncbi:hypothetical protein KL86DYS2_11243 [uncultured Dysgonomonas sp.]|uniref:Uncharacterized protein n=1 Tax=uncultured Dysgonomonas sp. TaxID=206096 RepID=A0A212JCV5_9BACT|nr:hypothetical protein KL86DYS2_11243 [uncultured Dysgonomonas sp.]
MDILYNKPSFCLSRLQSQTEVRYTELKDKIEILIMTSRTLFLNILTLLVSSILLPLFQKYNYHEHLFWFSKAPAKRIS